MRHPASDSRISTSRSAGTRTPGRVAGVEYPELKRRIMRKLRKRPHTYYELINYERSMNRFDTSVDSDYEPFVDRALADLMAAGKADRRFEAVPMGTGYADRSYYEDTPIDEDLAIKNRVPVWMFYQHRTVWYEKEYFDLLVQFEREEDLHNDQAGEVDGREDGEREDAQDSQNSGREAEGVDEGLRGAKGRGQDDRRPSAIEGGEIAAGEGERGHTGRGRGKLEAGQKRLEESGRSERESGDDAARTRRTRSRKGAEVVREDGDEDASKGDGDVGEVDPVTAAMMRKMGLL